ncbi:hypothetical protein RFI_28264, partial [Reticulomyxa filosa]
MLILEGFQDMNDLSQVTFADLIAMDMPRGHARRLLQQLSVLKQNESKDNSNDNDNGVILSTGKLPKSNNNNHLNINVLLLGDAFVGKTSLRKRMELNEFVLTNATNGVELSCLLGHFKDEPLQVTVWDPAGQERYAPIAKTFFRRAHGAAVVFSADDPSTWKGVEYWFNELDNNAPDDIEAILICNKIDVIENDHNYSETDYSYPLLQKAIEVARSRRMPLYLTSAKSGECVKQAFQEL